jgi:hypothetical protein
MLYIVAGYTREKPAKAMFTPHPNLSDDVNRRMIDSEIEGGVFLEGLPPDTVLHIRTQHHSYTATLLGEGSALLSGHPQYCPEPVEVIIAGSTWGGSMLKMRFIGRGMNLEFHHPAYKTPIVTSPIQEICEPFASLRTRRTGRQGCASAFRDTAALPTLKPAREPRDS